MSSGPLCRAQQPGRKHELPGRASTLQNRRLCGGLPNRSQLQLLVAVDRHGCWYAGCTLICWLVVRLGRSQTWSTESTAARAPAFLTFARVPGASLYSRVRLLCTTLVSTWSSSALVISATILPCHESHLWMAMRCAELLMCRRRQQASFGDLADELTEIILDMVWHLETQRSSHAQRQPATAVPASSSTAVSGSGADAAVSSCISGSGSGTSSSPTHGDSSCPSGKGTRSGSSAVKSAPQQPEVSGHSAKEEVAAWASYRLVCRHWNDHFK
jgi:hypothetical protein